MKKLIVTVCVLVLVGMTRLVAANPVFPGFNDVVWTDARIAEINALTDAKYNDWKLIGEFYTAAKANPKLRTDYDLYMAKMDELTNKYGADNFDVIFKAVQLPKYNPGYFSKDFYSKLYYAYTGKNDARGLLVDRHYLSNAERIDGLDYQKAWTAMFSRNEDNFNFYNDCFTVLKKNQFQFKDEDLKANLKKLNRMVYPNISQNDAWKQLAVQIQLLLKMLE